MLVWGGASSDRNDATLYADGASYDPATQKWTTLPAAPLSARSDMGWVWTGTSLVIFGGEGGGANTGSSHALADGAIYSPASNSWRMLPKAPLSARFDPELIWTGREVLVIGGDPDNESIDGPGYVAGEAAYDPVSNRWTTLPPMPMTPGHDVRHLRALMTERGVFVGELWQHVTTTSDGGELDAGTDTVVYDPSGRTWSRLTTVAPTLDDQPAGLDGAMVASDRILVLPGQGWHGDGSLRPASFGEHGYQLDLTTNRWSQMAPGPIDKYDPVGVWTGAALLEYDGTVDMSLDSGPTTGPGESAAFDPSTSTWVSLPTATPSPRGDNAVWAGDRLLEWGLVGLSFGPP